jgi:hypothetical protein
MLLTSTKFFNRLNRRRYKYIRNIDDVFYFQKFAIKLLKKQIFDKRLKPSLLDTFVSFVLDTRLTKLATQY